MLSVLALALALQATPAPATPPAKPAKGSPEEVVCRYEEVTGSTLSQRVCHTRADWGTMSESGQQSMDRYRSETRAGAPH